MKTYFIVNPKAGQGIGDQGFQRKIEETSKALGRDVEIYSTEGIGCGENFVRTALRNAHTQEEIAFIACGGDGTLNEVLNGTYGYENAIVGEIPIGTGNDFIRNFSTKDVFLDIKRHFSGEVIVCDAIEISGVLDGKYTKRLCANMFNIGFDCNVVDMTTKIKKKPFIKGSMAYILSIFIVLIKKHGANVKIQVDGEEIHNGNILLTSIANGSYCGGGVKSNPYAKVMDGKIDLSVVKDVSRLRLINLFPKYRKGTHMDNEKAKRLVKNLKGEEIIITPLTKTTKLCIDGELYDAEEMSFKIVPRAFKFLVPKK